MKRVSLLYAMMLLLVLTACDAVHQFPEAEEPNVPNEPKKVKCTLTLEYAPDFYFWEHVYDPVIGKIQQKDPSLDLYPGYPGTSSKYDNTLTSGFIETRVKAYSPTVSGDCVFDETFISEIGSLYDRDIVLELEANKEYQIAAWSQLVTSKDDKRFYDPSNFYSIKIIPENYTANTDYRDAFSGMVNVTVGDDDMSAGVMKMTRPMGKFEIVTVDLSEFLDRETKRRNLKTRASADEYTSVISFIYYPSSHVLFDDRLESSSTGVNFRTQLTVTGDSEASLGFEYVMINNNQDAGVNARIDIFDNEGTQVAQSTTLVLPIRRDHHTYLKGAFLREISGGGGIGIDPGFDGDHNITI